RTGKGRRLGVQRIRARGKKGARRESAIHMDDAPARDGASGYSEFVRAARKVRGANLRSIWTTHR
ncbi:hypothetical protein, partial [Nocardia sp. NPDC052112]|uniref:hypothetical protein n=1 Tax=Nocardia sp. NPDC052112 TaxID=3155646 RepID=UPI0034261F34